SVGRFHSDTSDAGCVDYHSSLVRFCGATYEPILAASLGVGHYPTFRAAFLDISLSTAAIYSRPALRRLCCVDAQSNQVLSYESHVAAAASFQTSAIDVALTRTA